MMIRKCCTTSIKSAVLSAMNVREKGDIHRERQLNYVDEAPGNVKVVAVVRDPVTRLISAWRHRMWEAAESFGSEHLRSLGVEPYCSLDEFLDQIEPVMHLEGHVMPQVDQLPDRVDYMLQFERIGEQWPVMHRYGLGALPHRNTTKPHPVDCADRIREMYRDDVELWEKVCARDGLEDPR